MRERAQRHYEYCHANAGWQFVRFTSDHVLPQSAGGSDNADNLALACRNCNERRGNRVEGRDPETETVVSLFNPRRERWVDHSVWDTARLRIIGRTSTGRATVVVLDMHDDRHEGMVVRIRQCDVADGYHPAPEDPVLSA